MSDDCSCLECAVARWARERLATEVSAYMRRRMAEGPVGVEELAREIEEGRPWSK